MRRLFIVLFGLLLFIFAKGQHSFQDSSVSQSRTISSLGARGLNLYANTHKYVIDQNGYQEYGYLRWKDNTLTDFNGRVIHASKMYSDLRPIGSNLFGSPSRNCIIEEKGRIIFKDSVEITPIVYNNLIYLENWSLSYKGIITKEGRVIVPFEKCSDDEFEEKLRLYLSRNSDNLINTNVEMILKHRRARVFCADGTPYLIDDSDDKCCIIDFNTGQEIIPWTKGYISEIMDSFIFSKYPFHTMVTSQGDSISLEDYRILNWDNNTFIVKGGGHFDLIDSIGNQLYHFESYNMSLANETLPDGYEPGEITYCSNKAWFIGHKPNDSPEGDFTIFNEKKEKLFNCDSKHPRQIIPGLSYVELKNGKTVFLGNNLSSDDDTEIEFHVYCWNDKCAQ